ncbi:MAG: Localization factor PodJL [Pseudomonadota bacterium]|jgi:TPR repeat protein
MNFPRRFKRPFLFALTLGLLLSCGAGQDPLALFKAGQHDQAHDGLQRLATQGSSAAQNALATQYYLGLGTGRNLEEAARWFEEAALSGNSPAQVSLGILYLNGWGLRRDHAKAFGWFQAAADAGNPRALHYLAVITDKLTPNQMTVSRDQVRARLRQSRAQ